MKITDLLSKKAIQLNGTASSKEEAISKMVDLMANNGNIVNKEEYKRVVMAREQEGTTGIGEGIAIPHGKTDAVSKPGLAAMVIPNGVNFDSMDGQPARLIFLIAAPNTKDNIHLDVLSRLSTLLMDTRFREELLNADTPEEFLLCIDRAERIIHIYLLKFSPTFAVILFFKSFCIHIYYVFNIFFCFYRCSDFIFIIYIFNNIFNL